MLLTIILTVGCSARNRTLGEFSFLPCIFLCHPESTVSKTVLLDVRGSSPQSLGLSPACCRAGAAGHTALRLLPQLVLRAASRIPDSSPLVPPPQPPGPLWEVLHFLIHHPWQLISYFLCLPNAPLCRFREGKNWVCLGICKVCGITEWRNSYRTQVRLHATHKPIIQEASVNRKERCFDQKSWQLQGGGGLMSWDHLQRFCPALTVFGFLGFFFQYLFGHASS